MKRILVALDGSQRAPKVLETATRLAELSSAKLVLFRAITLPPETPRELFTVTDAQLDNILRRNAHTDLERLARDHTRTELVEAITTDFATPWDGVCRAARDRDVDLIVLGSHGYGGFDRLLGTTAAKVVNHAHCNVFVVRTPL